MGIQLQEISCVRVVGHATWIAEVTVDYWSCHTLMGGLITDTPNIEAWSQCLIRHSDQKFAQYMITGLKNGFRIGYDWSRPRLCAKANMPLVKAHPAIVQ